MWNRWKSRSNPGDRIVRLSVLDYVAGVIADLGAAGPRPRTRRTVIRWRAVRTFVVVVAVWIARPCRKGYEAVNNRLNKYRVAPNARSNQNPSKTTCPFFLSLNHRDLSCVSSVCLLPIVKMKKCGPRWNELVKVILSIP